MKVGYNQLPQSEHEEIAAGSAVLIGYALVLAGLLFGISCAGSPPGDLATQRTGRALGDPPQQKQRFPVTKTDEQWRKQLTPEQYQVLRQKGTERAFTGALYQNRDQGVYLCAGCGQELFQSADKFDSGSGWPSFTRPADTARVTEETDGSHGMVRTEVMCSRCGGHLGHIFPDGPAPTGQRYCINSVSLAFEREK